MSKHSREFKCYVAGLPWAVDDQVLKEAFSVFGDVVESKVITDHETGKSKGFGFVTFAKEQDMKDAIEIAHGKKIKNTTIITVQEARSRRHGGGQGGGGSRGRRDEGGHCSSKKNTSNREPLLNGKTTVKEKNDDDKENSEAIRKAREKIDKYVSFDQLELEDYMHITNEQYERLFKTIKLVQVKLDDLRIDYEENTVQMLVPSSWKEGFGWEAGREEDYIVLPDDEWFGKDKEGKMKFIKDVVEPVYRHALAKKERCVGDNWLSTLEESLKELFPETPKKKSTEIEEADDESSKRKLTEKDVPVLPCSEFYRADDLKEI